MSRPLRKRCPVCKKLRGFCEPSGDQGGSDHPSRKPWKKIENIWVCGWCAGTPTGAVGRGTVPHDRECSRRRDMAIIPLPIKDSLNMSGAEFSEDRVYRYRLWRHWRTEWMSEPERWIKRVACFCLLNPSLANEVDLDPTLRRCRGFAMDWNCTGMVIVNLFALVTPYPDEMHRHDDPVGIDNDKVILQAAKDSEIFVAGWGNDKLARKRAPKVLGMLREASIVSQCLGTNKDDSPKHPLYLAKSTQLVPYEMKEIKP